MRRSSAIMTTLVVGFCLATPSADAKKNDPHIELEHRPTESVHTGDLHLTAPREQPAALRFTDGRNLSDTSRLGTRTDDRDRSHELYATNDVMEHVSTTIRRVFEDWGIPFRDKAERVLEFKLLEYGVTELNKAVGASYDATVRFELTLSEGEEMRWEGKITGSASRWGKKFSGDNTNEVLSDATLEALSAVFSSDRLENAWRRDPSDRTKARSGTRERTVDGPGRHAISPETLVDDIGKLVQDGFEADTILAYLEQRALTRPLGANQLLSLKQSGIPEAIVRAAMALPIE